MDSLEHSGELSPDDALYQMRHSLSHVLAQAVLELRPGSTLGFGPPIKDGFYYDFILSAPITEEDFPELEQRMRKILKKGQRFDREELPKEAALARLAEMKEPYKREYALELFDKKHLQTLSFYRNGPFLDMCEGPHVHTTKEIPRDAFKLKSVAGAYWRGDSKNVMMTRIYAWAFASKEELDAYVARYEQALARDHKKLGRELGLYHLDNDIGKGLPLWLPNGTVIRDEIEKLAKELEFRGGYQRVSTPHLAKADLYYRTGHLPYYADHMYPLMEMREATEDGGEVREAYALRPMNCPHHHRVYASSPRSYRELPLRLAEYGQVYRFEDSGAVGGLVRVRGMCINDAHIYCTAAQVKDEFKAVLAMYAEAYAILGLDSYTVRLSRSDFSDPKGKEKYIDNPQAWAESEQILTGSVAGSRHQLHRWPGRSGLLRTENRHPVPDRDGTRRNRQHGATRLRAAGADGAYLCRPRRRRTHAVLHPSRAIQHARADGGVPDRTLRRRVPDVARADTGAGAHRFGTIRSVRTRHRRPVAQADGCARNSQRRVKPCRRRSAKAPRARFRCC